MNKIFVIAGTAREATEWARDNLQKRIAKGESPIGISEYLYVSNQNQLFGIKDPHGVFVGNWLGRPDILEIVQTLLHCSTHTNTSLAKIHTQVRQATRVRPTPKLTGSQITQAYVDEAAQLMAQEIDAEVLRKLTMNQITISQGKADVRG
jgi:hypothetical protein